MIFTITHKVFDDSILDTEHYAILHVGKNNNCKNSYLRDDVGDNISEKNCNYCELTGLYWIWKNYKENPDAITGLVHYRRFFTTPKDDLLYTYFNVHPKLLDYSKIKEVMKSTDLLVPKRVKIFNTVKGFYSERHNAEDLTLTKSALEEVAPDYINAFEEVMNSHYFYYANMMICKRELLDKYCTWLFSIMIALEKKIDIKKYENKYQQRVYGFISERLLQVWIKKNNLSVAEYPVFNTEEKRINIFHKNMNRLKKLIGKIKL